jgi:Ca2+-binding RTX toxin-like protein
MSKVITNGDRGGVLSGTPNGDTIDGQGGADLIGGGAGDDTIYGGLGNDHVNGGPGHDILTGGPGSDLFAFKQFKPGDSDRITDFHEGLDMIGIDGVYLKAFRTGEFSNDEFVNGTEAHHRYEHLIYDQSTGSLFYDPDGSGSHEKHLLATFDGHPTITADDFLIFLKA